MAIGTRYRWFYRLTPIERGRHPQPRLLRHSDAGAPQPVEQAFGPCAKMRGGLTDGLAAFESAEDI
jgi:hypothetical protein